MANPPVGTVAMFGGEISGLRINELRELGWLLCDGQSYANSEYPELHKLIKTSFGGDETSFQVPDLRGRFVRATDHGRGKDPEAQARQPLYPGGNKGDALGSAQRYATKLPTTNMVSDTAPDHVHIAKHLPTDYHNTPLSAWGDTVMAWTGSNQTTSSNGDHTHTVVGGGDSESRPINVYLHWVIKYR